MIRNGTTDNSGVPKSTVIDADKLKELTQFRKSLPITNYCLKIVDLLKQNRIVIIAGDTGSGKTTQIPQYIYEAGHHQDKIIGITQPRRVAAMSIAQRVAEEKGTQIGSLVGYSIRFEERVDPQKTKIKFMTDGMLLREMIIDPLLTKYAFIVIDEAHERSLQSDILLGLMKGVLSRRMDLKLVVMSATLETEKFMKYFSGAKYLEVEGRTYPTEIFNTKVAQADYLNSSLNSILQIHFREERGDILVFLTGQEDIEELESMLKEKQEAFPLEADKLVVCPIYAALPSHLQLKVFESTPPKHRKVVLATNIAETSLTIDGIKYVVDCGLVKLRSFNPNKALESLFVHPVSKSSAIQRAGRAGRQSKGKCFRLYTKETFENLELYQTPEVLRTDLASTILQLKAIGVQNVTDFAFIDKPKEDSLAVSLEELTVLGALDETNKLTELGREMAELPLNPAYARLLILSANERYSCSEQILSIVALINTENLFYVPKDEKTNFEQMLKKFKYPNSDHLTKLNILNKYLVSKNRKDFCKQNYINKKSIQRTLQIREQLAEYLTAILQRRKHSKELPSKKVKKETNGSIREGKSFQPTMDFETDKVVQCMAEGLRLKMAKLNSNGSYTLSRSNQTSSIHPESVLSHNIKYKPENIVYSEVVITKKTYLRDITEITKDIIKALQ